MVTKSIIILISLKNIQPTAYCHYLHQEKTRELSLKSKNEGEKINTTELGNQMKHQNTERGSKEKSEYPDGIKRSKDDKSYKHAMV